MGGGNFGHVGKKRDSSKLPDEKDGSSVDPVKDEGNYVAPPDGGWGWMVVLSSFLIHVIADGVVYSFGVFLMELVDFFKTSRGDTSWVGSLQPAVTFTVGPLSSALTNRYGCRPVTIAGAIIAGVGFILSTWAPNLSYLYFTCGIMAGVGFGLIYLPAIVCVAQYFEKKRSFATGLAVCGSGFGTFILAPITEMLVAEYSWRGAMLIMGGIILNVVACGIIFRPLEQEFPGSDKGSSSDDSDTPCENITDAPKNTIAMEEIELLVDEELTRHVIGDGEEKNKDGPMTEAEGLEIIANLQQQHALPSGIPHLIKGSLVPSSPEAFSNSLPTHSSGFPDESLKNPPDSPTSNTTSTSLSVPTENISKQKHGNGTTHGFGKQQTSRIAHLSASQCLTVPDSQKLNAGTIALARSDGALHKNSQRAADSLPSQGDGHVVKRQRHHRNSESSTSNSLAPLSRKDIFYSGSLFNIPMYRSHPDEYKATVTSVTDKPKSLPDSPDTPTKKGGLSDIYNEFRSTMRDMLSLSLLKNPVFLMFGISNFFTSIGFNMPFIFLPDRAHLDGIDQERAAYLLSVIGIANTLGRIIFGFLSDRPWVNRLMLYNTALTICGGATALSPVVGGNYELLVVYAAVFGLFIGVYVSLTSVVLVDLLGLEYLTNAFGLLLLFQGAATFIGPPIAGWMCDWTGSYDISFIVMGCLIALSGAMLYFLPCVQRYAEKKMPQTKRFHDIELGKHSATEESEIMLSSLKENDA
ncbi:monocarboxylate transporter 5 [Biomphalaria glabrata]